LPLTVKAAIDKIAAQRYFYSDTLKQTDCKNSSSADKSFFGKIEPLKCLTFGWQPFNAHGKNSPF
jgi:hypothetical protein